MKHSEYMAFALDEANTALSLGEAPIGCIIVKDGEIIARGYNTRETERTALGHAELSAIAEACKALGTWRLSGCSLYVTMEPCPMCMGAILNARIDRVIFGAYDFKAGCCGSLADFNAMGFNHRAEVLGGIREADCRALLTQFFGSLRK